MSKKHQTWIKNSRLIAYLESPKGLIPLIAAVQHRIGKVHQVMDYRNLNGLVSAFTTDTDDCNKITRIMSTSDECVPHLS